MLGTDPVVTPRGAPLQSTRGVLAAWRGSASREKPTETPGASSGSSGSSSPGRSSRIRRSGRTPCWRRKTARNALHSAAATTRASSLKRPIVVALSGQRQGYGSKKKLHAPYYITTTWPPRSNAQVGLWAYGCGEVLRIICGNFRSCGIPSVTVTTPRSEGAAGTLLSSATGSNPSTRREVTSGTKRIAAGACPLIARFAVRAAGAGRHPRTAKA